MTEYTDDDKAADLAALRKLSAKVTRHRRAMSELADQRVDVARRLRIYGGATYPELAEAMGLTYSSVQRLLERVAAKEAAEPSPLDTEDHTPHTDHLERESTTDDDEDT